MTPQRARAMATGAAATAAAAGGEDMRQELEQFKLELGIRLDARCDQIKKDLVMAGETIVDGVRSEVARLGVDLDRLRVDCGQLQSELVTHQAGLEYQIGQWQGRLQRLLMEFEGELRQKFTAVDADLVHQHQKLEGVMQQARDVMTSLGERVSTLEGQVQGKGGMGSAQAAHTQALGEKLDTLSVQMATLLSRVDLLESQVPLAVLRLGQSAA